MWSLIGSLLTWLLNFFFQKKESEVEVGQKLGQEEVRREHAEKGLREVTTAIQARDADLRASDDDAGRLSDPTASNARPYVPGPD